jgi:hypothetical protein
MSDNKPEKNHKWKEILSSTISIGEKVKENLLGKRKRKISGPLNKQETAPVTKKPKIETIKQILRRSRVPLDSVTRIPFDNPTTQAGAELNSDTDPLNNTTTTPGIAKLESLLQSLGIPYQPNRLEKTRYGSNISEDDSSVLIEGSVALPPPKTVLSTSKMGTTYSKRTSTSGRFHTAR